MPQRGLNPQAYRIGWICPLEVEQIAAMDMLDEEHESLPQNPADHNVYKFGSINHHNIVIAGLPTPGNCSAAIVVAQMRMTFPNLRYGLLVGIGGGVPVRTETGIIRLGHVVVGTPTGIHSGTIQYDYGKAMEGSFERTGSIPPPPTFLLNAARALAAERASLDEDPIWKDAQRPLERSRTVRGSGFGFPGAVNDHLFPAHYTHQQAGKSCTEGGCDMNQRIDRHVGKVEESFVVVHRGTIASGELVVKTAVLRDRLADQNGVLCCEMEAAEALADFPCMVIRGISDYCDSHKNDQWHGYAAAVAAAYARQLFFHLLQEEPHNNDSLAKFQLPSTLPAVREADQFIARTDELRQLHSILSTNSRRRTAVVHGLGGIGKTQLTLEYCERHRTEYSSIIWLNARDESSLKQSFTCVAERILSYDPSMIYIATALKSQDTDGVIRAVKCWLDEPANDGWLLICDKYDHPSTDMNIKRSGQITMTGGNHLDEEATTGHQNQVVVEEFDLRLYLPETDHGAVIITSRQSVKMGRPIKVGKLLAVDDSLAILASTSGRLNIKLEPGAVDIARQLDGVPLALATTGAYLNQVAMTCAKYFQLYNESWLQLHEDHPLLPSYDRILYSTWNLSHEHIKQQEPAAAMVLQQWAYFSNGDMWYELLKEDWETKPGWLTEVTKDKLQFHKVMRVLCKHGLAEISPSPRSDETESQGYSVHDCVHSWMEYVLNQGTNDIMLGSAIHCVALHAHSQDQKDLWRVQQRLLVHADRCLTMAKAMDPDAEVTVALGELGFIFTCQGRLQDAEIVLQRALARKEKALGPDHISTINTVNNLGLVYIDQGRLQDAEFMLQRALASKEKALAPDCISTLETVNNLGILYMDQRRLEEAEAMYQRALEGYEKELGPDHISTINTVNSLGGLYKDQGRLQDAEASIQRALEGYEKALGPDHITTLETVHNLGIFYAVQGRLEDAEALFQRALEGKEKVCGPDDISTFYTVNNLGLHYQAQGRLHDAEAMFQRAVKGYEKAFGPTPAVTYVPFLTTVENLARLYVMLGRTGDALLFDQRALVGAEAVWGRDNQRYTRIAGWVAQHQRSHD